MRPFSEYILLFGAMIIMFISYLVITLRTDDIDYEINSAVIPGQTTANVAQLYISPGCTSGSYATFKKNGSHYKNDNYDELIVSLTIPGSSAAAGLINIGYGDTAVECGSAPSNAVQVYGNTIPQTATLNELSTLIKIPKEKYAYIYISGFDFSAAAVSAKD